MNFQEIKNKFNTMPIWLRWVYYVVLFELGLLICFWLEVPFFYNLAKLQHIRGIDQILRVMKEAGYYFTWIIIAVALVLIDFPKKIKHGYKFLRRGLFLLSSALLSGLIAEILKIIIRRERPEPLFFTGGNFRDWVGSWWKSNDLGTPSSHAMVAFGAAWALCIMFPQARLVWIFIGVGCAVSRMAHQAHLLGDVYLACVLSYIITKFLARKFLVEDEQLDEVHMEK